SGPVPSPGIRVTSWAIGGRILSCEWGARCYTRRGTSLHPMSIAPPRSTAATHDVVNQAPPLVGYNVFEANRPLVEALRREGAEWARDRVAAFGVLRGDPEVQAWARQANENPPALHTHDRYGHRIDEVEFHPAWHELLGRCVEAGVHALPWRDPQPGAHVARGALMYVLPEAGVGCPISMTYAAVP